MSKIIPLTITEDEYAELEAALDYYVTEIRKDSSTHKPAQQPEYLNELTGYPRLLPEEARVLKERILRLELELQHTKVTHARELACLKEAHACDFTHLKEQLARERKHIQQCRSADRESFRLQIENLILRMQRGLPPPALPEKPDDQ